MQIGRMAISKEALSSDFGQKASLFLVVTALSVALGATMALWHPLLAVGLVIAPLVLFFLLKYPEVGLICYATCLVFITPVCDSLNIPIGYQALSAGIILSMALLFFVVRRHGRLTVIGDIQVAALCLGLLLFLGLMWTPSPNYGWLKVEGYLLFNILLLLGVSFFGGEILKLKRIVYIAAFLGVIFCFWDLVTVFTQQSAVWTESALRALDPIGLGRRLGVFAISLVILTQITKPPIVKALMWAIVAALVFLMFYTGARGPVFSLLLTLLLYVFFLSKRPLWQGVVLTVVGGITLYAIFSIVPLGAQSRFLYPTDPTSEAGISFVARQQFWQDAIDLFRSHPIIGVGTGGYSYYATGLDIRDYPHNLFLEIACEIGILGIVSFLAFLFTSFRLAGRIFPRGAGVNKENFLAVWGISIFIFALANSMVSGDIYTNSLIWFSCGFMWATYITFKKDERNSE